MGEVVGADRKLWRVQWKCGGRWERMDFTGDRCALNAKKLWKSLIGADHVTECRLTAMHTEETGGNRIWTSKGGWSGGQSKARLT